MKKILFKYSKGFTLIELLVVIAIIGILTAIVTTNFATAKSKARDAKRISDIAQLQLTLEQIFDRCSKYPQPATGNKFPLTDPIVCNSLKISDFISVIPKDPTTGASYDYAVSATLDALDHVLRAKLENNSPAMSDSVTGTVYSLPCVATSPPISYYYCVQPK